MCPRLARKRSRNIAVSLSALIDRLTFTRLGATDRPKDPKIHFAINRDCGEMLTGIFFMPNKSVWPTDQLILFLLCGCNRAEARKRSSATHPRQCAIMEPTLLT